MHSLEDNFFKVQITNKKIKLPSLDSILQFVVINGHVLFNDFLEMKVKEIFQNL